MWRESTKLELLDSFKIDSGRIAGHYNISIYDCIFAKPRAKKCSM